MKKSTPFVTCLIILGIIVVLGPILILPVFVLLYLFIATPVEIRGNAMAPQFPNGAFYFVNKTVYKSSEPKRTDVIVFKSPPRPEIEYVKRVIAIPGETVEVRNEHVFINGVPIDEPYLAPGTFTLSWKLFENSEKVTVPENSYFVLGDDRTHSSDSREWGFVPRENIIGKLWFCYWNCSKPQ